MTGFTSAKVNVLAAMNDCSNARWSELYVELSDISILSCSIFFSCFFPGRCRIYGLCLWELLVSKRYIESKDL